VTFSSRQPAHDQPALRVLVASGRYREALTQYFAAADAAGGWSTPQCRLLAAQAAARIGEFEVSSRLAASARAAFEAGHDIDGVLESHNLLGALAFERGRMREAEQHFSAVAAQAEQHGRGQHLARSANNLGSIEGLRGETAKARTWYERALLAYEGEGCQRGMAETSHNLALVLRESGALAEARGPSLRAVELAEQVGEAGLIALTLLGRAELRIECGSCDDALEDIQRAEQLAWQEGNEPHRLEAERLYALIAFRQGQSEEALRRAALLCQRATEAQFAHLAAEARALVALALKALGRHTEAVAAQENATVSLRALGATARIARLEREWKGS
jgi:tetratricopeptide (TPR) repeat protein